jgi:hypothetical protein
METRNPAMKRFAVALALAALAASWAAWPAGRVWAIQDSEDMPSPISIAAGQTLQLNVANASSGDPIQVEITILDDGGNPLMRSRELVLPRHTAVLKLNRDGLVGLPAGRLLTRAVVKIIGNPGASNDDLVVSQEVVDNETQKTVLLHPGISKGFNPQPDPPAQR